MEEKELTELIGFCKTLKLLYVEDNEEARLGTSMMLGEFFDDITVAVDGEDGLKKFKESEFDLIVSDINMPKMNGIEMAAEIKKINNDIAVLILSAYNETSYFLDTIKIGIEGYLLKPIDLEQFLTIISKTAKKIKIFKENIEYKNSLELKVAQEVKKELALNHAIEQSSMLVKFSTEGKITFVNDEFVKVSGYTKDEIIGKQHDAMMHKEDYDNHFNLIWNEISSGRMWKGALKSTTKEGETIHLNSVIVPIKDVDESIIEYLDISHDVSEIVNLYEELDRTQKDFIFRMGVLGETRSEETGNHVKRVAQYSRLLALKSGLSEEEAETLYTVSPMHDIGKVGIPDSVLKKEGHLTSQEREIMNHHPQIGYDILKDTGKALLEAAATVCYTHHEKYDGSGYPNALKGEDIPVFGRITAIADVFDALGSERVYKKAWPLEKILELFDKESGKHFDPKLIQIFKDNLDEFLEIRDRFCDIDAKEEV
jgi:PAS domain S-box-containing protein